MFLLVFVTLLISIVDLYAQVVSVQTARIYGSQTALAQIVKAWHASAVNLAISNPLPDNISTSGCMMTVTTNAQMPPPCTSNNVNIYNPQPNLSAVGYANMPYTFMTEMFYSDSSASPTALVITFVWATDGQGQLIVPDVSGITLGYSIGDLGRQMSNVGQLVSSTVYGPVTMISGVPTLTPHAYSGQAAAYSFTVPSSVPIPSLALISAAR